MNVSKRFFIFTNMLVYMLKMIDYLRQLIAKVE